MPRKYSMELLKAIEKKQYHSTERGLDILVKPIPDCDEEGVMDPRLYNSLKIPLKVMKLMPKALLERLNPLKDIKTMRKIFGAVKSIPICENVVTTHQIIKTAETEIPVRIYLPKEHAENLPIFYYIHGGGFAAGSLDVVEEMCKLMVENMGCVTVSVDYRLAPENPYPAGLNDCFEVLKWIYNNAESIHGDKEKICISGDSAGGNLSTVCAMKDRDEGTNMVKLEALIYPTVNMVRKEDEDYYYDKEKEFKYGKKHKDAIEGMINMMRDASGALGEILGENVDIGHKYLSPYVGDLKGMPPTIILYGEYDFLKVECESYARKLKKAGVEIKTVKYLGQSHGFVDVVGTYPQAEDCINEIAQFMKDHF